MRFILIGIDLEATGKKKIDDQITQVGLSCELIDCENENKLHIKLQQFQSLVQCDKKISEDASNITGIKDIDLKNAKKFIDVFDDVTYYIQTTCEQYKNVDRILVAYNGKGFDIPLLVNELRRHGKNPTDYLRQWKISFFFDPFIACKHVLDTTLLEKNKRGQPNYKLTCVYTALFKKPLIDAHTALADVNAMLELITENKCLFDIIKNELTTKQNLHFLDNLIEIAQNVKNQNKKNTKIKIMTTSSLETLIQKSQTKKRKTSLLTSTDINDCFQNS